MAEIKTTSSLTGGASCKFCYFKEEHLRHTVNLTRKIHSAGLFYIPLFKSYVNKIFMGYNFEWNLTKYILSVFHAKKMY